MHVEYNNVCVISRDMGRGSNTSRMYWLYYVMSMMHSSAGQTCSV